MSTQAMRACSACAGDYEDPDRTAPVDEEAVEEAVDDASIEGDRDETGESVSRRWKPGTGAEEREEEFPGR